MASPALPEPRATPPRPTTEEALYEVVNGQRVELPPMSVYAGWIASRLDQGLGPFVEEHRLGTVVREALFILDPERNLRRRPDVAFVSAERWPLDRLIPEEGDWDIVPDLAVEVVRRNHATPKPIFSLTSVADMITLVIGPLGCEGGICRALGTVGVSSFQGSKV